MGRFHLIPLQCKPILHMGMGLHSQVGACIEELQCGHSQVECHQVCQDQMEYLLAHSWDRPQLQLMLHLPGGYLHFFNNIL